MVPEDRYWDFQRMIRHLVPHSTTMVSVGAYATSSITLLKKSRSLSGIGMLTVVCLVRRN